MGTKEQTIDRQIAVLIDLENVSLTPIGWLFDQISDVGRIIVKKAYADWSVESRKRDQLLTLGIEPIHLFRSTSSGKNSGDIRLAIDAVDLLYTSPVDTFLIVSSDSDFVPLVSKLRAAGKTVFGAGEQGKASPTLVKSCDRYFYLDQDKNKPASAGVSASRGPETESLIMRAVHASMDDDGRVFGSRLHQTMQRLDPSFDYRSHHSTFIRFVQASPGVKLVPHKGPGDFIVELADQPSGQTPASPIPDSEELWTRIGAAWSKRAESYGKAIPGPIAAADAAKVLGVGKLSASPYRTLQGILDASNYLAGQWLREGNTIIKR